MKTKLRLLAMFLITSLTLVACGDDDDDSQFTLNVPTAVTEALHAKYPGVTHIEWDLMGKYYVAECRLAGKDMDVWFGAQGDWVLTEVDIAWNDLPAAVQTTFLESEYASWKQEEIDELQHPLSPTEFVIQVEQGNRELQLFYSASGELMEVRDVTGKDDTHWPKTS